MSDKIIDPVMTDAEKIEMEKLVDREINGTTFRAAYQMGFAAGKLSCLTDILNNSKLFNGQLSKNVGDQSRSAAGVPGSVEQAPPKGSGRSGNRGGKDKAGH